MVHRIPFKIKNTDFVLFRYAVEGTPLTFSRADSLSSLGSGDEDDNGGKLTAIPESGEEKGMQETEGSSHKEQLSHPTKDNRTVSFNTTNYAVEVATPSSMQLSRASSIASLESYNQNFTPLRSTYTSCATSNRASPTESDLPDSPTQPMPPAKFPPPVATADNPPARPPLPASHAYNMNMPPFQRHPQQPIPQPPLAPKFEKPMFSDGVKAFQEEGTPLNFSCRTSLSALTFDDLDDHPAPAAGSLQATRSGVVPETNINPAVTEAQPVKEAWTENQDYNDTKDITNPGAAANNNDKNDSYDDDEDIYADSESILDQIIKKGMPTQKSANASGSKSSKSKIPQPKSKPSHPVTAKLNESRDTTLNSDDSCSSLDDSGDLLQACIASGMIIDKNYTLYNRKTALILSFICYAFLSFDT